MGEVWFAPDDPSLPTPWKGVVDGATGCLYYWNPETNITQYEKPEKPTCWVSAPSLVQSYFTGPFYRPPSITSDYNFHSQYSNLYPNHQTPAETVINGYTFPTQFPFPNHTHNTTTQPIYPQSPSTVEPIYPEFPSFHPESNINPSVPTFQSPYDLNPPIPTFVPHLPFSDPKSSLFFLPMGDYEPQPISLGLNAPPNLAVHTTDLDHSTPTPYLDGSSIHPSIDFNDVPRPQLTSFHLKQAAQLPEVSEIEKHESMILLSGFANAREESPTSILRHEQSSVELVQAVAPRRTTNSTNFATQQACDHRPLEKLCAIFGGLRTLNIEFEVCASLFDSSHFLRVLSTLIVPTTPDLAIPSAMLPDSISPPMFNRLYPLNEPSCQPHSLAYELVSLTNGDETLVELWDDSGGLRPMNSKFMVSASLFDNCHFFRAVDALLLQNMDAYDTNSNMLSKHDSESTLFNHASFLHFDYERKNLHIPGWFEEFQRNAECMIDASWKAWKQYIIAGILIDQFHDNKLNMSFFLKCRASDKKCMDAFLNLEFFVSYVTSKLLPSESCRSGSLSMEKAMMETSPKNPILKIVVATICKHVTYLVLVLKNLFVSSAAISSANLKQLSYAMHLVDALATETVGRTISTDVDLQILDVVIAHALQLGLSLWIVVMPFVAVIRKLLVIGINSNSLITASLKDFRNSKLLVCSLITTAASRKFWGQVISLDTSNSDGQLPLRVQSIFCVEFQLMDSSCILHTTHEQSHFLVQLQQISGIIFFVILEQLKKTYAIICFVILVEEYLMNYLLSSEDLMSEHWSNKSSKFGECMVHELSHCMDKMMISPKLDDTSWKLVVIQSVKVVLKENANSYHYVKGAVSLVILHLGRQPFFFLYDGVGHFQTDVENLTIINGGAKDGNMLSCKIATEVSVGDVLGLPEIYVAWKKTKFLHVFYITILHSIFDVDLGDLLKTLVSANDTWKVILIFHAIHSQAFSMSLFEIAPKQFYTARVAAKVRQCALTMLNMTSAIFSLAKIELGHHYPSLEQADDRLKINSMVVPLRYCSGAHLTMVTSTVMLALVLIFLALTPYYNAPSMINLFEATLTHSRGYWLNWEVMPHAPWDFIIMLLASLIVGRRVVQVQYWQWYADGAGQRHSLILGPPFYKMANFSRSNTIAMHLLAFVVIFGGIVAANSIAILHTGQEYGVQSYMKEVNAHPLLILNPSVVVVQQSMLILSTFKLIFALVMAKNTIDADDIIAEVRGNVTVHHAIPFIMLTNSSCGYWNAKKAAKAEAQMQDDGIQSTANLCTEFLSNVAGQTKAIWLELEDIWFNSPPTTISRHEDIRLRAYLN